MDEKDKLYFKEIKNIEDRFSEIMINFDSSYPRVLNADSERKKFFMAIADDKVYNPKFKYEKKVMFDETLNSLNNFKINLSNDIYGFKKLYKEKIEAKINQFGVHKYWGFEKSSIYSLKYHSKPSFFLLRKAKKYAKEFEREVVKFSKISVESLAEELKDEVKNLTGEKLKVICSEIPNKMNINPHKHLLKINCDEKFTSLDLKRLKTHEIGTHFMRYYNGKKLGLKLLERGTGNYTQTEEGLAVYMEEIKGVLSMAQMYIYAGRVIATYYTNKMNFYDLFHLLKEYGYKDKDAYALTFRVKRSICDTSKLGGYTKDYVYFDGYFKVKKYAKKHDVRDLFIGKVKIEDLKVLSKFIDVHRESIETIL